MDRPGERLLPGFDQLPLRPGDPPRSAWGLWGEGDEAGTLNLLTPERVAAAARLARTGKTFALNWNLELPDPPLFGREALRHELKRRRHMVNDDVYHEFNTQSSSHWDGLTHYGNAACACFYNGVTPEQVTGEAGTRNGIQVWARRGIAGRGVLVDYRRWAQARGIAYSPGERHEITPLALGEAAREQGVRFATGDVLLVRSGWIEWYLGLDEAGRRAAAAIPHAATGLAQGDETLRFLWDTGFAAVAGDAPAFEAYPAHPERGFMHETLLALWGMPIGEMFDLEALAADCAADGVYECFFTAAPLNKLGGVASPANALAIK
ncbi:MAG: cyclase family protein [Chloroflexota bacterium]|nr:cyclase family protein [Chloroflexota bacterium]